MSTSVFGQLNMYMREIGLGFFVLFLIVLAYYFWKSDSDYRKRLVLIVLLSCGLVFNNLSLRAVGSVIGLTLYYRFFWAVPILIIISKGLVDALFWKSKKSYKVIIIVLVICTSFLVGSMPIVGRDHFRLPGNAYQVSGHVMDAAHIMNDVKNSERPVIIGSVEIMQRIKQYDGSFVWGIGREPYREIYRRGYDAPGLDTSNHTIIRAVELGILDDNVLSAFQEIIDRRGVEFIVTFTEFSLEGKMKYLGFYPVGHTGLYTVFQRADVF